MGRGSSKAGSSGASKKAMNFEKQIYTSNAEKALIITSDGKKIKFGGDENHVFGTKEDIALLNGATATHNHPNGSIFSTTDVGNGIAAGNLKEMRIVTKDGDTYSLKNKNATAEQRKTFSAQYRNQEMKANNNIHMKQRRGEKVDSIEYTKNHMTKWMENHASEYGLEFKKGKVKK